MIPESKLLEAILQDVIANPGDDTPRLAYADVLTDMDTEESLDRAELIRTQIELHGRGWKRAKCICDVCGDRKHSTHSPICPYNKARRKQLKATAERLLRRYGFEWAKPVSDVADFSVSWERGFVNHVRLELSVVINHGGTIFKHHPIRSVFVQYSRPSAVSRSGRTTWHWAKPGALGYCFTNTLPGALWRLLPPEKDMAEGVYSSYAKAIRALSDACIRYGREPKENSDG
jgi:uncharacterized protein (TIGR02996 family)